MFFRGLSRNGKQREGRGGKGVDEGEGRGEKWQAFKPEPVQKLSERIGKRLSRLKGGGFTSLYSLIGMAGVSVLAGRYVAGPLLEHIGVSLPANLPLYISLLASSAYFSGSETALVRLNDYHLLKVGGTFRTTLETLMKNRAALMPLILFSNTFVNIALGAVSSQVGVSVGATTSFVVAFSEILPKSLAMANPVPWLRWYLPLKAFLPAAKLLKALFPGLSEELMKREERLQMVLAAIQANLTDFSREALEGLLKVLESTPAQGVSIPPEKFAVVEEGMTLREARDYLLERFGRVYSLVGVVKKGALDRAENGNITIEDLMGVLHTGSSMGISPDLVIGEADLNITPFAIYTLNEHKPIVAEVLGLAKKKRRSVVVVVKEDGETVDSFVIPQSVYKHSTDLFDALDSSTEPPTYTGHANPS